MEHHVQIRNVNAEFISAGAGGLLMLAVRSLSAAVSQEGIAELIRSLIPQEPLQATIVDHPGRSGCHVRLQATRWGFSARINVTLEPASALPGGILINVESGSSWSPLDRTMLTIATSNLSRIARSRPEVARLRAGAYQLDLQRLIRDRLLESSAPVRWDARLDRIDGDAGEIRVTFVSSLVQPAS